MAVGNTKETQFSAISVSYTGDGNYLPHSYEMINIYGPGIGERGLHLNPRLVPENENSLTFFKKVASELNSGSLTLEIIMPARSSYHAMEDVRPGLQKQIQWVVDNPRCFNAIN